MFVVTFSILLFLLKHCFVLIPTAVERVSSFTGSCQFFLLEAQRVMGLEICETLSLVNKNILRVIIKKYVVRTNVAHRPSFFVGRRALHTLISSCT